ncbi:hypothetical protein [Micromonospora taraxaci]|uniref:hypothetical protein n=1 Tax=Micromonospora taraxaci TaxID=1316803 RepID=UPI00339F7A9C
MGNSTATRILLLIVAVLAACLAGMTVGWVTWAIEPSAAQTLIAGGSAFSSALALMLASYNFVMRRDA